MNISELKSLLNKMDRKVFSSSAHDSGQHRIFGFTTTNIRSVNTIAYYLIELIPEYIKRKNNYQEWKDWFSSPSIQKKHKQKFRRLELAKILFRNFESSKTINGIGEHLFHIYEKTDQHVLEFILYLYLLTGRYFDVDNQPLVETSKVLASWDGDFLSEAKEALLENTVNISKPILAMLFYNPSSSEAFDIAYALIQNTISSEGVQLLQELSNTKDSIIYNRKKTAGGITGFKSELAVILNYFLFKKACEQNIEDPKYETIITDYINLVFENKLNVYFKITDKDLLESILKNTPIIFKDVFEFAVGIKFDNNFVRRKERKNIKQESFEKYGYRCFFDSVSKDSNIHLAHKLNYFLTKKSIYYLEGHHMIQMENSKFFEKDIDIAENIIPVCPNCHRKLHNADKNTVLKMLKLYYDNADKKTLIRKGIFVDIETLERFYGIEGE